MSDFTDFIFGKKDKLKKIDNFDPRQKKFFNSDIENTQELQQGGYQNALKTLMQYLDPQSSAYDDFEAPYLQQFEDYDLPMLAERFAGQSAMGAGIMNSGFGQAIGGARAGLRANLAGLKSQLQRGSAEALLNQYNQGSNRALNARPFDYVNKPGNQGILLPLLQTGIGAFGKGF